MKKLVLVLLLGLPLLGQALKPEDRPLQRPVKMAKKQDVRIHRERLQAEHQAVMNHRFNYGVRQFRAKRRPQFCQHPHFNHGRLHRHHRMMLKGRGF